MKLKKVDPELIQKNIEQRSSLRDKKKRPTMKKSGTSVKKLQELIVKKSTHSTPLDK